MTVQNGEDASPLHRIAESEESLARLADRKRVLFITLSDREYIRNKQELRILRRSAKEVSVVAEESESISPTSVRRILKINLRAFFSWRKDAEVVLIGGLPQVLLPLYFWGRGQYVIIDFFVSLFDTIILDRGLFSKHGRIARFLTWLDGKALSRADSIIVDTRASAKFLESFFGIALRKMMTIYLEPDRDIYFPHSVPRPPELEDRFIVLFFGAMNPLQGAEVILETASLLQNNEKIRFIMIGPYRKLKNIDRYKDLPNLMLPSEWLSQQEIARYIALADVCLAGHFSSDIEKAARVIPGKAYIYRAMDKLVILGDNSANRELFVDNMNDIRFAKMGDSEHLKSIILDILESREGSKHG